ncbi:hypothetical protein BDZ91DRAFT_385540 [Kalaharituber pfeilii]|nr:hypothetical protein BDZ91DRAFT_385540 [Kalaharituber pfeilii]
MLPRQQKYVLRWGAVSRAFQLAIRRHYAAQIDPSPADYIWPTHANPTPYQILGCAKGDPYSKRRYYDLCKLYHPDRYCSGKHAPDLPDHVRNDRFKLIVAANEILSDPHKRWAYDRYGAGWNGQAGITRDGIYRHASNPPFGDAGKEDTRPWWRRVDWSGREGHYDPHRNATWEDWERYYAWRDGKQQNQQPLFMSNLAFISLLFMTVSLGSILSINHAQAHGKLYLAERDKLHDRISKDLERRKREAVELGDKDERVRNFLRNRDPFGYINGAELVQEKYRRLLPIEQQDPSNASQAVGVNDDQGHEKRSDDNNKEQLSTGALQV